MEKCFVMLKPGVINRRLVGVIISRLEKKGLKLIGMKIQVVSQELAAAHYAEHEGKVFYTDLINYITSGPVIAMVWKSDGCVAAVRRLCGATTVEDQAPGTIRGDFCMRTNKNIIHASDSPESAEREVNLWFSPHEMCDWVDATGDAWI